MRKLTFAAAGYASALLLAHYLFPEPWLLWAAAVCLLLGLAALFLKKRLRLPLMLAFFAAAVGFAWTLGYTALTVQPAEAHVGEVRTVSVRIASYPTVREGYSSVEAVCIDGDLPHGRMLIYDYDAGMGELCPGDLAEMELKLLSAAKRYNEEDDYYVAGGIHYRGYVKSGYSVTGRARLAWLYFPQKLAVELKTAALNAFPEKVAPLMKALLTGDKTEYYEDDGLYTAMRSAGFSHIVAVSGMHVAFLISLLSLLTGRRRRTALIGIPLIVVFMAMVGFTPSVVRAGIMQILLLIAPLLRRENDPPTSLSAALLILLLVNPLAIGSLSLQLSFAAMAGLLLVSPRIYNWLVYNQRGDYRLPKGFWGKRLRGLCGTTSASIGAIVFTTPLSALYFGFVPLYGILTNLLCLWAMSAAFLCGYAVCIAWLLWPPVGIVLGWIIGWLPRYAIAMVKFIAKLPYAVLITRANLGAWWLVFVYVIFIGTYLLKGDERYRPVLPVCACLVTLAAVTLFMEKDLKGQIEVTAVDVGQGLSLVALTEDSTVVIDCGSTGSATNAGDATADYLLQCGCGTVDLLILTHFHADHANGVRRLMSRVDVKRIAFSPDCEENEYSERILRTCAAQGTEVLYIEEDSVVTAGELDLTLYAPLGSEDANEHCLIVRGDHGDFEFLVTGDAGSGVEKLLTTFYDLGDLELLVVGHHGSRYSTCDTLLDEIKPEYAFISVGAGNSYGHPTTEVLERLEEHDIEIYRTDLHGTISLTVGSEHG